MNGMIEEEIPHLLFILLLLATIIVVIKTRKLTLAATITAALVVTSIYAGTGFPGVAILGCFFIIGVAATAWKKEWKQHLHFANAGSSQRNTGQVLANGGVAAGLGLLAVLFPDYQIPLLLVIACSLSAATADTSSSELGVIYGRKFYNILSLKKDTAGENGVVSLEGTLIGVLGSIVIALVYGVTAEFRLSHLLIIVIAGTVGNLVDSIAGAALERKELLSNNAVNLVNTFSAAATGAVLYYLITW